MANQFLIKNKMVDMRGLSASEIASLQGTNPTYAGVELLGYYEKGDTPAPIRYYVSNTITTDDGGSIIEVGGIKLEHKFNTELDTSYFGASSALLDSRDMVNASIKYANSNNIRTVINTQKLNVSVVLEPNPNDFSIAICLLSNIDFINKGTITLNATTAGRYAVFNCMHISNFSIEIGNVIGERDGHLTPNGAIYKQRLNDTNYASGDYLCIQSMGFLVTKSGQSGNVEPNPYTKSVAVGNEIKDVDLVIGEIIKDGSLELRLEYKALGEWGTGIRVYNCKHYKLYNGKISNCWGDGIILTAGASSLVYNEGCTNGIIDRVVFDRNRRQGLTIGCVDRLAIDNCLFQNTIGTNPQAGVDIEPNNNQNVRNVSVTNSKFLDNNGNQFVLSALAANTLVESISVANCDFNGTVHLSSRTDDETTVIKNIEFNNCNVSSKNFHGFNLINRVKNIKINNCVIHTEKNDETVETYSCIRLFKTDDCTITNNKLSSNGTALHAISVTDVSRGHSIENNSISNTKNGITCTSKDTKIDSNSISNITANGIRSYGDHCTINNNILTEIAGVGIRISAGNYSKMISNIIHGSGPATTRGIFLEGSGFYNDILSNTITDVVEGIFGNSRYSNMIGNTITGCFANAISNYSSYCTISNNKIINSGLCGLSQNGGENNTISSNMIIDSSLQGTDNTLRALFVYNGSKRNTIIFNTIHNLTSSAKPRYGIEDSVDTSDNNIGWNNINQNFYVKVRSTNSNSVVSNLNSDVIDSNSTADANDSATVIALANSTKSKLNEILDKMRIAGYVKKMQ